MNNDKKFCVLQNSIYGIQSPLFQATDNTIWCLKFVFKIWKLVDIIFPTLYFLREIGHVTPSCNGPTFVLIENASILF